MIIDDRIMIVLIDRLMLVVRMIMFCVVVMILIIWICCRISVIVNGEKNLDFSRMLKIRMEIISMINGISDGV